MAAGADSLAHRRVRARCIAVRRRGQVQRRPLQVGCGPGIGFPPLGARRPAPRQRHLRPFAAAAAASSLTAARAPAPSQFQDAAKFNADISKWNVANTQRYGLIEMVRVARPRGGITSTQTARAAAGAASLAHRRVRALRVAVLRRGLVQRRPLQVGCPRESLVPG